MTQPLRLARWIAAGVIVGAIVGCGVKAPPRPPSGAATRTSTATR